MRLLALQHLLVHVLRTARYAAPLPHVTGSTGLRVLRRLRPSRALHQASRLSAPSSWQEAEAERLAGGSHIHCCPVGGLGTRLYPCGIATATPQHFTVASRPAPRTAGREFPAPSWSECA